MILLRMRKITALLMVGVLLLASGSLAQQPPSTRTFLHLREIQPDSFEKLVSESSLIVIADLGSQYPSYEMDSRIQTDGLVRIVRVLKGSESSSQLVVAQVGGKIGTRTAVSTQFEALRSGERYILFLTNVTPVGSQGLPMHIGIARYQMLTNGTMFSILDGEVYPNYALPFRALYNGRNVNQIAAEIERTKL